MPLSPKTIHFGKGYSIDCIYKADSEFPSGFWLAPCYYENTQNLMKLAGFFWLVMGWAIIVAAIAMLQAPVQARFVLVGFAVQLAGVVQVVRAHILPPEERP